MKLVGFGQKYYTLILRLCFLNLKWSSYGFKSSKVLKVENFLNKLIKFSVWEVHLLRIKTQPKYYCKIMQTLMRNIKIWNHLQSFYCLILTIFRINQSSNYETYDQYIKINHNVLTTGKVLIARLLCAGGNKDFALDNVSVVARKNYGIL